MVGKKQTKLANSRQVKLEIKKIGLVKEDVKDIKDVKKIGLVKEDVKVKDFLYKITKSIR